MIATLLIAVPILLYLLFPLKKRTRYIVAAILVGVFCLLSWPSTYKNYRLDKFGWHTTGKLISKSCTPKKRQWIAYKFTVGSTDFEGTGKPRMWNRTCESLQIGDQVPVIYVLNDPSISSPVMEVDSDIGFLVFLAIGLYIFLIWGNGERERFLAEKRRRKTKNA